MADVRAGRLTAEAYGANFCDLHPPLSVHEARVAADRCYFCYDAPCVTACPTAIDVPLFIRQIQAGDRLGAGKTIFDANVFGGTCARVCPTETLCEGACVRMAEGEPVAIGALQRHATDPYFEHGEHPFVRMPDTGRRVAVVGAGPAGLSCAHALARRGHAVMVYEARDKPGGLNEYGIAAYKMTDDFAQREVEWLLKIGGIELVCGAALGRDVSLPELMERFDAVFLGMGLGGVNALGVEGETGEGVADAVSFIADLRQADNVAALPVGRRVAVIGGGMTAIDAAVQSRRLGAEEVTILYRRGQDAMPASQKEQRSAQVNGVTIRTNVRPVAVEPGEGAPTLVLERTALSEGRVVGTGEMVRLPVDVVYKAIGQQFLAGPLGEGTLTLAGGRLVVDDERRTSMAGVWAGGDCVAGGEDLTVVAVEDGKRAAVSIDRALGATHAVAA